VATLLFPVQPPSSEVEIRLSQALVDAATVGIAQRRELDRLTTLIGELEGALDSRVVIEQAKGVVAERAGVSMDLAFTWIRRYARAHNALLVDSARLVIDGRLPVSALRGDSTPC
jgi:AmiR/NasT family two-component response regulator